MDDSENVRYARAPEIEDLVKICDALNKIGAEYVVIGGFAVGLQGSVRSTKDIDFLVNPAPENVRKIKTALSVLKENAAAEIDEHDVINFNVVRIGDEIVIDLLGRACGVDYAMASPTIETKILAGVAIPVADKATLIKTKATVRNSDKVDCYHLRCLIAEEEKTSQKS